VSTVALIVAAGRGTRAGGLGSTAGPKQYASIGGKTVLVRTLEAFSSHPGISAVWVVIHPDDRAVYDELTRLSYPRLRPPVYGGPTRQDSVRLGLEAIAAEAPRGAVEGAVEGRAASPRRVLIHDAARPFVSHDLIGRVIAALDGNAAVVPALPVAETLKRAGANRYIVGTVDRHGLYAAQTPQGFAFDAILAAHRKAATAATSGFTDDASIAEWAGIGVAIVDGSAANIKLTTPEDLRMADERLSARALPDIRTPDIRTGQGFDVHRFTAGDHVWLCGLEIPHTHGLDGHSDADVGLHALTDALLGAIADGDIGLHFNNTDPRWKGAASHLFLADAARRVAALGGRIANVDITILCEAPKITPHRDAMRARIAEILALDISRVAVKATTTEGLGFTGRREGIAALASATLILPS
jgi:2-C-methyl-D-erythritol 4-phosphate cytidylyltransferase / 2-C-methyl-D-erythritol 2,4-cyclodiphosphate synthase